MSYDRGEGAFLGLCIGDSAGAVLDIPLRDSIDPDTVERALSFPGGGAYRVGPAQITDKSELAMALAHALSEQKPPEYPADEAASAYAQWLKSKPFCIGKNCRAPIAAALQAVENLNVRQAAEQMAAVAVKANAATQSNGAVSRAVPLAIWGHHLDDLQMAFCAEQDSFLTHPHENCRAASAVICVALRHLISNPGNAESAIQAATTYAAGNAPADIRTWLDEALHQHDWPSVTQAGTSERVRWPLFYAFRHLKRRSSFEVAIRDILGRGGSTAANAAIVGAVIGALHGSAAIPSSLKDPVLARGTQSPGNPRYPRPPWFQTRLIPSLTQQLFAAAEGAVGIVTPDKIKSR